MTPQQFQELKSLIDRNFEMIGRIYEEHGGRLDRVDGRLERVDGRLTRVEVGQEQLSYDLRAVAEGVTGNSERIGRLEGRFDGFEAKFDQLSVTVVARFTDHDLRLRALED
jgi:hypothetical protein